MIVSNKCWASLAEYCFIYLFIFDGSLAGSCTQAPMLRALKPRATIPPGNPRIMFFNISLLGEPSQFFQNITYLSCQLFSPGLPPLCYLEYFWAIFKIEIKLIILPF